jgi:hypothetical protein
VEARGSAEGPRVHVGRHSDRARESATYGSHPLVARGSTRRRAAAAVAAAAATLVLAGVASRQLNVIRVGPGDNLQAAIDAAKPGDIIALAPGAVFTGNFVLPERPATSAFVTIRTDASDLPGPGERTSPRHAGRLAALQSPTNAPALRTAKRAHHWRLENIAFRANRRGEGDVVALGHGGAEQREEADVPRDLVLDRVLLMGDPIAGQKRGVALNSRSTTIVNSHIAGVRAVGMDSQGVGGWNGPGPFTIENNFIEAAGENVMFGGSDPSIDGLVPTGMLVRRNHFAKPVAWRGPVVPTPAQLQARSSSGGALARDTYSYSVVAEHPAAGTPAAVSAPSEAITVVVAEAAGSVTLEWTAVPAATGYRVYRRRAEGGTSVWWRTTKPGFVDTGSEAREGAPPRASRWTVKNLFELKSARDAEIDANLFEYNWRDAQTGSAIVIKPENQDGRAPWTTIENVRFTNNVVRHAGNGINLAGMDDQHPSQRARGIVIRGNTFEDIDGGTWGGNGDFLRIGSGPIDVVVEHNVVSQSGKVIDVYPGKVAKDAPGFVFRGNLVRHNRYGVKGPGAAIGLATLRAFFPDAVFAANTIAGGKASDYPPDNRFVAAEGFEDLFAAQAKRGAAGSR